MRVLEKRVDRLEDAIAELARLQQKTEINMQKLQEEMREFKEEMSEFKNEMLEFKSEMSEFKDRMDQEIRRINKQWGELAHKMGTVVEDIVYPGIRPIIKRYFKCDPEILMSNVKRKKGRIRDEFDIIAVCTDKVFLIEVKSTLRSEHIRYMNEKVRRFKELFSEYKDKKLVPVLATLKVEEKVLKAVTRKCIFVVTYREWEYLDILNFEECKKCLSTQEKNTS